MQARYYDPVIGRFYSNDPVGYTAKNPVMSFNRYMYVNNNPYKYKDPSGEFLAGAFFSAALDVGIQLIENGGGYNQS
ncbi:RHS repeat-associated core domain-containing protein [Alteromonas sp. P256]|uniref:RHS repeat-associated core domain-containing protein n=1 Tax=Alteromonas sp. P256 TaxID=3117399 RepID=UPI002FE371F8